VGTYPFNIELGVIAGNKFHIDTQHVTEANLEVNGAGAKAWHASYILNNETQYNLRNEVIRMSKEHRLLSQSTVFLCLERGLDEVGENDEVEIVSTEEVDALSSSIPTFPNPFSESLTIEIPNDKINVNDEIDIQIFNMQGQLVKSTNRLETGATVSVFVWDDVDLLSDGMYTIRIRIGDLVVYKKVILI